MAVTVIEEPVCLLCKHLFEQQPHDGAWVCSAFPKGIPDAIWGGAHEHQSPFAGDDGIQFELMQPAGQQVGESKQRGGSGSDHRALHKDGLGRAEEAQMMKTMVATFWRALADGKGQEVVGRIVYSGGKVAFAPDDIRDLVSHYAKELEEADDEAIVAWMRKLPARFDGGYVRAGLVEA